jgi:hypothetical protein
MTNSPNGPDGWRGAVAFCTRYGRHVLTLWEHSLCAKIAGYVGLASQEQQAILRALAQCVGEVRPSPVTIMGKQHSAPVRLRTLRLLAVPAVPGPRVGNNADLCIAVQRYGAASAEHLFAASVDKQSALDVADPPS